MSLRTIVYLHLSTLLLLLAEILMVMYTQYDFKRVPLLIIFCFYLVSSAQCLVKIKQLTTALRQRTGNGVAYALSLSSIFIVESLLFFVSVLIALALLIMFSHNSYAKGKSYEIRSAGGPLSYPHYKLYRNYFLIEQDRGSLNMDVDNRLNGKITEVVPYADSVVVHLKSSKDTVVAFLPNENY